MDDDLKKYIENLAIIISKHYKQLVCKYNQWSSNERAMFWLSIIGVISAIIFNSSTSTIDVTNDNHQKINGDNIHGNKIINNNSTRPIATSTTLTVKEFVFINNYSYVQAITDTEQNVIAYAITTRNKNFNLPINVNVSEFDNIRIGKSHFSDTIYEPNKIIPDVGANFFNYFEEFYLARPGGYQTIYLGINDAGYINMPDDLSKYSFLFESYEKEIDPKNTNVTDFRKKSIINTYMVASAFADTDLIRKNIQIGIDSIQASTLPATVEKEKTESKDAISKKLKLLYCDANIEYFIKILGDPVFTNNIKLDTQS